MRDHGTLAVISARVPLLQTAACWVALSPGLALRVCDQHRKRLRERTAHSLERSGDPGTGPSGPAIAASPGAPIDAATRGLALAVLSGSSTRRVDLFEIDQGTGALGLNRAGRRTSCRGIRDGLSS